MMFLKLARTANLIYRSYNVFIVIMRRLLLALLVLIPYAVKGEVVVPVEKQENGLCMIPCKVNGVSMKFVLDTGASDVSISLTEAQFMLKNGYIQESDIKGTSLVQIANGEIVENTRILLRKIEIGDVELSDVDATVSHSMNAPLLLGQSAISKLGAIQLDGKNLILKDFKGKDEKGVGMSNLLRAELIFLIVLVIVCFVFIAFSKTEGRRIVSDNSENLPLRGSIYLWVNSLLSWLGGRKYVIYITYVLMLILSVSVVELHVKNKRNVLYKELMSELKNRLGDKGRAEALYFKRMSELEYEEVAVPKLSEAPKNADEDKKREWRCERKRWDNMFAGIKHVYKIVDQGWLMVGMFQTLVPWWDCSVREGFQEYFYGPYMICVPDGVEFNREIAKDILEKALDKDYCPSEQYDAAADFLISQNEYYGFFGCSVYDDDDGEPELWMHFYNEVTGTDPIYDGDKFTGYYRFGMRKIGDYRVLYAYRNRTGWWLEEKKGFNASIKDRVIYYSTLLVLLTSLLSLFLRCIKLSKRIVGVGDEP